MARTQAPPVNYLTKGFGAMDGLLISPGLSVYIFADSGAPTNGTSGDGAGWAGPGSLRIRTDTPQLHQNTNTKASPTWTQIS